jgi:ParB/RepB/Spo0J family partition protein
MPISNKYKRVPLEQIVIDREHRQRKTLNAEALMPSIKLRGVVTPVIVEQLSAESYKIVAGERRLEASRLLHLPDIPARLLSDLSPVELQIIELEENLHRTDLEWKDQALSIERIHDLYLSIDPDWTQSKTSEMIGLDGSSANISIALKVAEALRAGNAMVVGSTGLRAAYNVLARVTTRAANDAISELLETKPIINKEKPHLSHAPLAVHTDSILNEDFLKWAPTYEGQRFNLIHCDFPYGMNLDESDQALSASWGGYADTEDTYWELCKCLSVNVDRLMTETAHMIFWFSMEYYHETLIFFQENCPSLEFQKFPLIWWKTDNRGILPDPRRGPRRVYETAFLVSRGDRPIIRPVGNVYGAPKGTGIHQSEKSEPMLRHFFSMLVDGNTRMLDPTCGGGSALRAAESLGASFVLGLEHNAEFVKEAQSALRKFRNLRALTKGGPVEDQE